MPTRSVDIETFAANSGMSLAAEHGVPLDFPPETRMIELAEHSDVVDLALGRASPLDTPLAAGLQLDENQGGSELRAGEGVPLDAPTESSRQLALGNVEEQQ